MVKKAITIRLDEEMLQKIDDRGKRTDVIRNMIEYALRPKITPKIVEPKIREVIKEVPVETVRLVRITELDWSIFWKEIHRLNIKDEQKEMMNKEYVEMRIKDFEKTYGEKF